MEPSSASVCLPEFDFIVKTLIDELSSLHHSTGQKGSVFDLASAITCRLDEVNVAAALADQYLDDEVESNKLGHLIQTALAFALKAARLHDEGDSSAWLNLCKGHFVFGMAVLQSNLVRGAHRRVEPYKAIKETIVGLVSSLCPPEKWASLEDMWRAIEHDVEIANKALEGRPGFSADTKAAFLRLARTRREYFLRFLARPVKRGRPPKKRPRH